MWVIALGVAGKFFGVLGGMFGWLRDRRQYDAGRTAAAAEAQDKALTASQAALQIDRVQTRDELRDKLKKGDL